MKLMVRVGVPWPDTTLASGPVALGLPDWVLTSGPLLEVHTKLNGPVPAAAQVKVNLPPTVPLVAAGGFVVKVGAVEAVFTPIWKLVVLDRKSTRLNSSHL